jgi:hypothetical protein
MLKFCVCRLVYGRLVVDADREATGGRSTPDVDAGYE